MPTKIEWASETINPIRTADGGYHCTKISPGCANCYAEVINNRFGNKKPFDNTPVEFVLKESELEKPLRWKKPKRIFVQSMGDLFHPDIPDELISKIWDAMWKAQHHTFLILTKRPERMKQWIKENAYKKHFGWVPEERTPFAPSDLIHLDDLFERNMCGWESVDKCDCNGGYICDYPPDDESDTCEHGNRLCMPYNCPIACANPTEKKLKENGLDGQYEIDEEGYSVDCDWMEIFERPRNAFVSNVWLGATVENQPQAEERISILRQIPAAKHFVSVEPMLGPVDLKLGPYPPCNHRGCYNHITHPCERCGRLQGRLPIDWVICGGETGPKARPAHPDWVRSLRDQCQNAGVPFFFKSWGDWGPAHITKDSDFGQVISDTENPDSKPGMAKIGKKKAGSLLDGREWNEFPEQKGEFL